MGPLTTDQLQKFKLKTLTDSINVISSPALPAGVMLLNSPTGRVIVRFGPDRAPANLSPLLDNKKETQMTDISGQSSSNLSASANLSSLLVNRLKEQLGTAGSMEYKQTWKKKATPSGIVYWAHTASGRRISGSGSIGWPTPCQQDGPNGGPSHGTDRLPGAASLAGWQTPTCPVNTDGHQAGNNRFVTSVVRNVTGWPSPKAGNSEGSRNPQNILNKYERQHRTQAHRLDEAAALAGWATPTTRDHKDGASDLTNTPINSLLGWQVSLFSAPTEKRGALNPRFSLWLMGFPIEWALCAEAVMLSARKRRPRS